MPLDDRVRLQHMLEACQKIAQFSAGRSREDLDADELLALGIVRLLEVIGEAATAVCATVKDGHPEIPWRQIAATRNRLIHGYFDVDLDIVWQIVTTDVPPLIGQVQSILAELP